MSDPYAARWATFLIPIRSLGPGHRERIAAHLRLLDGPDRYLRFGHHVTDEQIARYVAALDFDRDEVFGIYNRRLELLAVAHLAFAGSSDAAEPAEFGVSVSKHARGRGYGTRLFDRAVMHARNAGVDRMYVHALSENAAMLHIARSAGATMERHGGETEAFLRLPPATTASRVSEALDEQLAQTDYQLKLHAHNWRQLIDGVQEVRAGVRESRHASGS